MADIIHFPKESIDKSLRLENGLYNGILLVPVHNEESEISTFLRHWAKEVPELPLILVFDRCSDNSLTYAQKTIAEIIADSKNNLVVHFEIVRENNYGKSGACLYGLWRLLRMNLHPNTPVIFWDSDNEYVLKRDLVEKMLHHVLHWGGMASARRTGKKLLRSRLAASAVRIALRIGTRKPLVVDDILTAAHALPLYVALEVLSRAKTFNMETKIVRYAMMRGLVIHEETVEYIPRTMGKKIRAYHLFGILAAAMGICS